MSDKLQKADLVRQLAIKMNTSEPVAEKWLETTLDLIIKGIKSGKGVTLRDFGSFYVKPKSSGSWVFRFNPSQKLRAFLGWSSTWGKSSK